MSKHTPGPWTIYESDMPNTTFGIDGKNEEPVVFYGIGQNEGIRLMEDARLIAAAPDLLEALQEVFVIGDRLVSDVYGGEFVEKARAAIAKATQ